MAESGERPETLGAEERRRIESRQPGNSPGMIVRACSAEFYAHVASDIAHLLSALGQAEAERDVLRLARDLATEASDQWQAKAAAAEAALAPFAHFARMWDALPTWSRKFPEDHVIYGIHTGTKWEAHLTLADFRRALAGSAGTETDNT